MIRLFLNLALLAFPIGVFAQDVDCPEVTSLRDAPVFDFSQSYPEELLQSVVMAEDRNYYSSFFGTSTITLQVAKQFSVPTQRTVASRAIELCLALKLADEFTQDEILTMWLQSRYFGRRCYGVENASEQLFGVTVENAQMSDFITLAALAKSPVRGHQDRAHLAQYFALAVENGVIAGLLSEDVADALIAQGPSTILDGNCAE
ncbi:Transglycosylase [Octadecabacter temperatus]|uniref:Penicillin-binding protein 1A n=1 Tax=Octadecabacter temperatus TaxID=1458307 RepID=A0A0K0Y6H0_9RHOB|nr:transglycosylase domain-containing protein [Octadecabacter temperatus]AKS46442.1 Penicillin-binding protein 1A [Octadecabacter temperatus]SIO14116.1 Transglycosylase [Octadecabacter temperatus]